MTKSVSIALVGCSGPKLKTPSPARQLYTSQLFRATLALAERRHDIVYVISAKHELVALDQVVAPYDLTMADIAKEWRVIWGMRAIARSGVVEWIDPFLGARLHYVPAPGEEVIVRGDVGGFGAGSKFTWQAIATYNWYLGTHAAIVFDGYLGYKALSVDYQEGSGTGRYEFDVIQQGPVMGITGRF